MRAFSYWDTQHIVVGLPFLRLVWDFLLSSRFLEALETFQPQWGGYLDAFRMFSLYSGIVGVFHGFSLRLNGPTTLLEHLPNLALT